MRHIDFLFFVGYFFAVPLYAQPCGTIVNDKQQSFLKTHYDKVQQFDKITIKGIKDIPVQVHVLRKSNTTCNFDTQRIDAPVAELNKVFIQADIRFVCLDNINFIDNDAFFDMSYAKEASLCAIYDKPNVLNLYIVNSIENNTVAGYAYPPPGYDRVIIGQKYWDTAETLIHELGHYFSLFHTHGLSNTVLTDELVNGSNCKTSGDEICDTPADPNLFNKVNFTCDYTKNEKDKNGDVFEPDTENFMSYAVVQGCRSIFTKKQLNRMSYSARYQRDYLKFPEKPVVNDEPETLSGSLVFAINGQPIPVKLTDNVYAMTEKYYANTHFRLHINNNEKVYLYVFSSNNKNETELLFPCGNNEAYIGTSETTLALPNQQHLFSLDEQQGDEYLCVLYSSTPIDIEEVLKKIGSYEGKFMAKLYQCLGDQLVASNRVQYDTESFMSFEAYCEGATVVPIVLVR